MVPDDDELHVLFVCTANISRSPYMELIARHRVGDGKVRFSSAGVSAQDDTLIDPAMAIELTSRGIGSDDFRSRRLTGAVLAQADLVLTAEAAHRARILDEHPVATRKVLTFGQADQALARVDLGISPQRRAGRVGRGAWWSAPPSLDVADPYRRGPDAARVAALEIDGLVERLLARLVRVAS